MNIKKIVKALLCASNGSEEIETVNLANTLVRAGINVIIAKVSEKHKQNNNISFKVCTRNEDHR